MSALVNLVGRAIGRSGPMGLRRRLIGATLAQLVVRFAGQILVMALGVTLARTLGAKGLGTYAYALVWINLVSLPAAGGLHTLIMREVAAFQAGGDWSHIRGLLAWSSRAALVSSLGLGALVAGLAWLLAPKSDPLFLPTLWLGLGLVPIIALKRLRVAALRGLHFPTLGGIAENLLAPVILMSVLITAALLMPGWLTAWAAMGANLATTAIAFLIGTWILLRVLPSPVKAAAPAYEQRAWLAAAVPLLGYQVLNVMQGRADILLLGILDGTSRVGIYSVALAGAELVSFFYLTANVIVAPTISKLYATGDLGRLQRMMTASARAVFAASVPVALVFILAGDRVLALVFGAGFAEGHAALAIYSVARMVNVANGWNGMGLIMTGHQKEAVFAMALAVGIEVGLSLLLIPRWGLTGAAAAGGASMVLWNGMATLAVRRRLRIDSTILGIRPRPLMETQS